MNVVQSGDRSVLWFGSGRQALFALFRVLVKRGIETVWLPEYHCLSMVSPCTLAGVNVRFYEVSDQLVPQIDTISKPDNAQAVIGVHYFGRPYDFTEMAKLCRSSGAVLIEDAAHVELASASRLSHGGVGRFGDYVLSCPRKFFDIYDGATLEGADSTLREIRRHTPSAREQLKSMSALLRRFRHPVSVDGAQRPSIKPNTDYIDPRFAIETRANATIASRVAFGLMFNRTKRNASRAQRYEAIHRAVRAAPHIGPLFADIPPNRAPHVYPAVLSNPNNFRRLRALGINALRWETFAGEPSRTMKAFMWSIVQLPCGDTMPEQDFQRMLGYLADLDSGTER